MDPKIIIAKPCHENWNKMSPEEQGRHCGVCSKVVKDFTSMQTEEILKSLKSTDGEVCGRINVKQLTPANKKQQVHFWINGMFFRKAIYPMMALLGVGFFNKKATAQTGHDYPLKGKVAYNNYHTNSKKLTIVVKSKDGNKPIANAGIEIISGIKAPPSGLFTDSAGRISLDIDANKILADAIEINISAFGFENKITSIKLIKDIQTVEVRMEDELMIMGEMMYIEPVKTQEEIKTLEQDSITQIKVTACSLQTILTLPHLISIEPIVIEEPIEVDEVESNTEPGIVNSVSESSFQVFPVPSMNEVTILSSQQENFNVDVFDGNGKKVHTIVNCNSRYILDVSTFAPGVYYALISIDGKAVETKKIVVGR
jgi:hypothetical protein